MSFANWSVQHVPRGANEIAHELTKAACLVESDLYLLDYIPICISKYALPNDVMLH